ncbi:hypothetical protein SFR_6135 [Streptomyces sp. FR-008]|nr:hypothetical protein SFR_6135 [Streptomyces sp. FR-008]
MQPTRALTSTTRGRIHSPSPWRRKTVTGSYDPNTP